MSKPMSKLSATLPAWLVAGCLPFVSRLLRGRRLRRQMVIAGVLSVITLVTGLWLALGPGDIERDVRRELGLEHSRITRELDEHTVFVRDPYSLHHLQDVRRRLLADSAGPRSLRHDDDHTVVHAATDRAVAFVALALESADGCAPDLRTRLRALTPPPEPYTASVMAPVGFYCTDTDVRRVERIVAEGFVPRVERYTSPLGAAGVSKMIGTLASGVLAVLLLIVAPLWVGSSVAQEVRDSTLAPLTGTALTSRQLAVGLAAGPIVAIAVLAVPFAALLLLSALFSGLAIPAIGALVMLGVTTILLSVLAEVVGLSMGTRRSPGVVGAVLLLVLGGAMAASVAVAVELGDAPEGLVAMLPQAGIVHLMRAAVLGVRGLTLSSAMQIDLSLVIGTLGMATLAVITLLAVERWLARAPDGLLRRGEALVGALTVSMLSLVVMWNDPEELSARLALTGALLAVPMLALLMARVPTGDTAPAMRTVPVFDLLAELAMVVGIHVVLCAAVSPEVDLHDAFGLGSIHTIWGIAVAGLVAIRQVAAPTSMGTRLLLGIAIVAALVEAAAGVAVVHDSVGIGTMLLPLGHASPVLGMLELVGLFAIPIALVKSLERQGVMLSASATLRS